MSQPVSIQTKNGHVLLRRLTTNDLDKLAAYLHEVSDEVKNRFGPHHFNKPAILEFYSWPHENIGFVAEDVANESIIGYAIIKCGYLSHDKPRWQSYGLDLDSIKCCTFAPSVTDAWQGIGIGKNMLQYILKELTVSGIQHVILWGGVQSDNIKAIRFYESFGFETKGTFDHYGSNYDMILSIDFPD
ncbi:MAG: N-acetyltransferase [Ferruginibacter sp.]|nr:N-acetyltransferase [Ferruginibacter sp.]